MSWRSGQAGCNIGKKPLYTGPSSGGFCSFSFCRQLRTGLCQVSCGLRAGPPPTAALLYDLRLSKRNVRRSQGEEAAVVAGGRGNRIRWCPGRRPISFSFFCGQVLPAVTNDFLFHLQLIAARLQALRNGGYRKTEGGMVGCDVSRANKSLLVLRLRQP